MAYQQARAPLTDTVIIAVSRLVDDAQADTREPSHSDIEFEVKRVGLTAADPKTHGQLVGKAKRVRAVLSWALENDLEKGQGLVGNLIAHLRGCGGFRETSPNYVGAEAIANACAAFRSEGLELTPDGTLHPILLDGLSGVRLTFALEGYVRRAKQGFEDAALLAGTSKDFLEATAAHVLQEKWGAYPATASFPALLGQAFVALGLATPQDPILAGEGPETPLQRSLYDIACRVNTLRNKQGTGHGRPWLPTVTISQARLALHQMAVIAEYMLAVLKQGP